MIEWAPIKMVSVSDHAIVRYLERVKGVDLELVREEIRNFAASGTPEGDAVIVEDGAIVTILGTGMRRSKSAVRRRQRKAAAKKNERCGNGSGERTERVQSTTNKDNDLDIEKISHG